jgi:hypothetical protein
MAPTEHEQMPTVRITLERLLQQRQAIKAFAHIGATTPTKPVRRLGLIIAVACPAPAPSSPPIQ